MRKYQQLLLLTIAALSIIALLLYRSENSRLRYVLDVVNMFGEDKDRQLVDLSFEYTTPFPIWQRIGNGFHAYSSFWNWDSTSEPVGNGVITAIVVGLQKSIVSFRCEVTLAQTSNSVANSAAYSNQPLVLAGKFVFIREDIKPASDASATGDDAYFVYKFICRVAGVPLGQVPHRVTFIEQTAAANRGHQSLGVRVIPITTTSSLPPHRLVACLDLMSPLQPDLDHYFYSGSVGARRHQLQFFLHHQQLGVDEFIVYDSGDHIALDVKRALLTAGVHVNYLPFNFPFVGAQNHARRLLRLDCELRTLTVSSWSVLLRPNEQLLAAERVQRRNGTLVQLRAVGVPDRATRIELHTTAVCLGEPGKRGFGSIEQNLYVARDEDQETTGAGAASGPLAGPVRLLKPTLQRAPDDAVQRLPADRLLANRYVQCRPMDRNAEVTHAVWSAEVDPRSARGVVEFTASVRKDVVTMIEKVATAKVAVAKAVEEVDV